MFSKISKPFCPSRRGFFSLGSTKYLHRRLYNDTTSSLFSNISMTRINYYYYYYESVLCCRSISRLFYMYCTRCQYMRTLLLRRQLFVKEKKTKNDIQYTRGYFFLFLVDPFDHHRRACTSRYRCKYTNIIPVKRRPAHGVKKYSTSTANSSVTHIFSIWCFLILVIAVFAEEKKHRQCITA